MKKDKNILIWGTAVRGQEAYEVLSQYSGLNVVAFGDNDCNKHNREFFGKRIINAKDLEEIENIDLIIIASTFIMEIKEQLEDIVDIPIYDNVYEFTNMRASIDIAGWCNAKCKWCATGIKNRKSCAEQKYMPFESFKEVYNHLINTTIMFKGNELLLYSWGEPYLNPDCLKIYEYLSEQEQVFSISTNASVLKLATKPDTYKFCKTVTFSMSGFSQNSYDIIHGFNIEKIKKNIATFINNMNQCGFNGEYLLSYHIYHFNLNEVEQAMNFADSLGIKFVPVYAYFAGYGLTKEYLMGSMSCEQLKEASEELILHHVDELLGKRPEGYRCLVENMISIGSDGNIELCCCCDDSVKDFEWGSAFNIKSMKEWKALREKMLKCATCKECASLKIDYWFFNNPSYSC